jgi:hypothetical protein
MDYRINMKSNVEKLQDWINSQKEHGLIDIKIDTIYSDNFLADLAVKNGIPEEQVAHLRVPFPVNTAQAIEDMAGEMLEMLNAPKLEDKDFLI